MLNFHLRGFVGVSMSVLSVNSALLKAHYTSCKICKVLNVWQALQN